MRNVASNCSNPHRLAYSLPWAGARSRSTCNFCSNTRGASIQQVVLSDFQQADREGLPVNNPDGTPKPLHLIPGVRVPRTRKIRDQRDVPIPALAPGKITLDAEEVEHPSYVMYHYEKESDAQPVDTLGNRDLASRSR